MTQIYDAYLAPTGLTVTQYSLLANLLGLKCPCMHDLAAAMGMDRTTLTRTLKPLMARGLVAFVPCPDRRTRLLAVTPEGAAAWQVAKPLWLAAQLEIQSRVGEDEVATLHRLLDDSFARLESG